MIERKEKPDQRGFPREMNFHKNEEWSAPRNEGERNFTRASGNEG
jgi:hypothetical protein